MTPDFDNESNGSSGSNNQPVLTNRDEGAAAWIEEDKNGNAYLSISLPFGLSLRLFPRDDVERDAMNALNNYVEEKR